MKIGGQMRKTETQNAKKRKIEFTENVENMWKQKNYRENEEKNRKAYFMCRNINGNKERHIKHENKYVRYEDDFHQTLRSAFVYRILVEP